MGSSTDPSSLPSASSPDLILTQATPSERERIWSLTHAQWGGILSHEQYVAREAYLRTVPLQITHWILTDRTSPADRRPILSSCDTYRKRALSCVPSASGTLTEGVAHGIGAVFTDPTYRGRGYASRMLAELGPALKTWQVPPGQSRALFSVLYSDIGKSFYARSGWAAFPSSHLAFPQLPPSTTSTPAADVASPIGYHETAELCAADEALLRAALPRRAAEKGTATVALVPDLDSMLWHLMREDFIAKRVFPDRSPPAVKGAVWHPPQGKGRVWAVWTRAYYGEVGTLHLLRLVVEDEGAPEEVNARGVAAVVRAALEQAREWRCREVQTWNPSAKLTALVERAGLKAEYVERDSESIASLMWYGEGRTEDVDWFYNEKFGWC